MQDAGDGTANAANCPGAGCRLRDALAAVSHGDTIDFSVTGTITLNSGELLMNNSITISVPGADVLAVNGNAASRIFYINPGKTVTISGLTITNGEVHSAFFPLGSGGGIFNDRGTLTVNDCTVKGNSADFGAGIYADCGSGNVVALNINNSTISGKSADDGAGGGIYNNGSSGTATLVINNCTVSSNSAALGTR